MDDARPKLRPVDAFPAEVDRRRVLCLRDPANLADGALCVPLAAVEILRCLDGEHSVRDIQVEVTRRSGEIVYREVIERLLETLDQHFFLESERFAAHRRSLEDEFQRPAPRVAFCAGRSYPAEPDKLRALLSGIMKSDATARGAPRQKTLRALIAPHIDFARGSTTYAAAYGAVAAARPADVYVILGTAHGGTRALFSPCTKDFETPLGLVATDKDFAQRLAARCPDAVEVNDFAHRAEHSVEFQAIFLKFILGDRPFRIVPVLCGSLHEWVDRRELPSMNPGIARFVEALASLIDSGDGSVCVVAGADFAHIGPQFGDASPVGRGDLASVESDDREMLSRIAAGDPDGFFKFIADEHDRRRVCGVAPIFALLSLMRGERGQFLHYGQWPDPQGTVTFGAVAFGLVDKDDVV